MLTYHIKLERNLSGRKNNCHCSSVIVLMKDENLREREKKKCWSASQSSYLLSRNNLMAVAGVSAPTVVATSDSRANARVKLQVIALADGQSKNKIC